MDKEVFVCAQTFNQSNIADTILSPCGQLFYSGINGYRNLHSLFFIGDDLITPNNISDFCLISVEFSGEPSEEMNREAWADPIRFEILHNLCDEDKSLYLGFIGYLPVGSNEQNKCPAHIELLEYLTNLEEERKIYIDTYPPFGYGNKPIKKLFFEVPPSDMEWVVKNAWPGAIPSYTIEGYCLSPGKIQLFSQWNNCSKDGKLFNAILKECQFVFFTHPQEHRHFMFLTNNYSDAEFKDKISKALINKLNDWEVTSLVVQ
jgi:hypothetical protein